MVTEDDQAELGMRVSCALYAENSNREKGRYDMICFRAYDAARLRRSKEKRNSGKTT
jgi:hypothetical protein